MIMKKIILGCALLFAVTCFAQKAKYGVKAGINISNFQSTNLDDEFNESRIGGMIGFFADYTISEKLHFQPEFLFSSQGTKTKGLRADYLQLPLLLRLDVLDKLSFHAGPQVGLKVYEFEDNFKNIDFALNAGIGVEIMNNLTVEGRYSFGLAEVFDDRRAGNAEGKNSVIQIGLSYKL